MRFRKGARLDTSQVQDVRGRGGGGGRGIAVGGGGLGLVGVLVLVLLQVLGGGGAAGDLGALDDQTAGRGSATAAAAWPTTARRARTSNNCDECRVVGYVNSIQKFWTDEFARRGHALPARDDGVLRRQRRDRLRRGDRATSARSTARSTSTSTSTSGSSTTCARSSARRAGRSPRRTCWRTSTATTSRTSRGSSTGSATTARGRRSARSAPSCRPTATPACGRTTPPDRLPRRAHEGRHRRRPGRRGGGRRRPRIQQRFQGRVTARRGRTARPPSASSGSRPATTPGARELRHLERLGLSRIGPPGRDVAGQPDAPIPSWYHGSALDSACQPLGWGRGPLRAHRLARAAASAPPRAPTGRSGCAGARPRR